MNLIKKFWLAILGVLLTALVLAGCSIESQETGKIEESINENKKLNVVVSILPQADFVKMVGGKYVNVSVMIPPGASPGSYEPTTEQLKSLSKAQLYISIGHLPFEKAWIDRILAANDNLVIIDSSAGIEIIDQNPHIWLSPRLVKKQVQNIGVALINADPENKEYYESNLNQALFKLDEIDQEIKKNLADFKGKTFLVYHPAWEYFARDYGLHEMAIEVHGKEPGPGEMARIIRAAKNKGIKTVFASPQHSTRSAETIAKELNGKVVIIDPLPANYEDILKSTQLICEAVGEQP